MWDLSYWTGPTDEDVQEVRLDAGTQRDERPSAHDPRCCRAGRGVEVAGLAGDAWRADGARGQASSVAAGRGRARLPDEPGGALAVQYAVQNYRRTGCRLAQPLAGRRGRAGRPDARGRGPQHAPDQC